MLTTLEHEVVTESSWTTTTPPPLAPIDRIALRVGTALILWGHEHAVRAERLEHARRSGAAEAVAAARSSALQGRFPAGPHWW
jgi:hypothetical protein